MEHEMMTATQHKSGIVSFFSTYRPPVPLDIYSRQVDDDRMTDGKSYNHNGHAIPPAALKAILKNPKLAGKATDGDVDAGNVTGMVFVSERVDGLELLHLALYFKSAAGPPEVYCFSDLYGNMKGADVWSVWMEDNGRFAGESLIFISTIQPSNQRRQPWTAVFKLDLISGEIARLTPRQTADLTPSVTPSGNRIAVASFEAKAGGWEGELEDLKTDIFVMNVDGSSRTKVIGNGGWPSWGSDTVLFFHRKADDGCWGVFRAVVDSDGSVDGDPVLVTPVGTDAVTPAAIDADRVAVAIIRKRPSGMDRDDPTEYRNIEIFSSDGQSVAQLTQNILPSADHYNPFVLDGGRRIGYHRCNIDKLNVDRDILDEWDWTNVTKAAGLSLFRAPGAFPVIVSNSDGTMLAFVDNEFKTVWAIAIDKSKEKPTFSKLYDAGKTDAVWGPVWNQNPEKKVLYVCLGGSFNAVGTVNIAAIDLDCPLDNPFFDEKTGEWYCVAVNLLTTGDANNASPSTNPEGTKLLFRSTRDHLSDDPSYSDYVKSKSRSKNLYIMDLIDDKTKGQRRGTITRITQGHWVDTHCEWSPAPDVDWIVFSSTRDKPTDPSVPPLDNGLDLGYFAVYIAKAPADGKLVDDDVVRVVYSGTDIAGHVNHPWFSPDGSRLVFSADIAGVSADPPSLPHFVHSVRPYGDLFVVDLDTTDIRKNKDLVLEKIKRITHSRFENSTCSWSKGLPGPDVLAIWRSICARQDRPRMKPVCPYLNPNGSESYHMTGHLLVPDAIC